MTFSKGRSRKCMQLYLCLICAA
ncbi:hypothetical protein BsWGS_10899 [Bradybaena similaris]